MGPRSFSNIETRPDAEDGPFRVLVIYSGGTIGMVKTAQGGGFDQINYCSNSDYDSRL